MKAIVFDIGNVLLRWDAHLVFLPALKTRAAVDEFLARIDFFALNLRADGGETFAGLAQEIADADDRALFLSYLPDHGIALPEAIEGSWALMDRLRAQGFEIHAITNWSAETWPHGQAAHPRLQTAFGVVVVSGEEKMLKPDAQIFATLCARTGLAPQDCLFIDDSPKNVEGARAFGMQAEHFTTPEALESALQARGLL